MIYCESLKFKNQEDNFDFGFSFKNKNPINYLTSTSKSTLNNLYYYFKDRVNLIDGNLLIDNVNCTELDETNYINFCYEHLCFFENSLIVSRNLSLKKNLEIYQSFYKKREKPFYNALNELFLYSEEFLKYKYKELSVYQKWRFKLFLCLLNPCQYVLIEPTNYLSFSDEEKEEIKHLLEVSASQYQKTFFVFQENNHLLAKEIVDLDVNTYYKKNITLTIGKLSAKFKGFSLIKNKFNLYKYGFLRIWWLALILSFFTFCFTLTFVYMSTIRLTSYTEIKEFKFLLEYSHIHKEGWLFSTWFIYFLNVIVFTIITYFIEKKLKNYANFLKNLSIRSGLITIVAPTLETTILLVNIFLAFIINKFIFQFKLEIGSTEPWLNSFYAYIAFLLYTFIVYIFFILKNNKKLNLKLLFDKMVN